MIYTELFSQKKLNFGKQIDFLRKATVINTFYNNLAKQKNFLQLANSYIKKHCSMNDFPSIHATWTQDDRIFHHS